MFIARLSGVAGLLALTILLSACGSSAKDPFEVDEKRLETGGSSAKYHYLLRQPFSVGLAHEGFIVGVEKSPNEKIGYGFDGKLDTDRFQHWTEAQGKFHLSARNAHLDRVTSDGKSMFVSHILSYSPDDNPSQRMIVNPDYLTYVCAGFVQQPVKNASAKEEAAIKSVCDQTATDKSYAEGWDALAKLGKSIEQRLSDAKDSGKPYSHILVLAMGWNNDQVESVRRYNAIIGNLVTQARVAGKPEFNPLTVAFTWPSVWGGDSFFNIINKIAHMISYPNKANDADEVGYTIANRLINEIIYDLNAKRKLKVVLIGHSLGARMLSRAMFSAHLLKDRPAHAKVASDLMVGLQGAFSVRRFKKDHRLSFPASLFNEGEGAPYLTPLDFPGRVLLTWSEHDNANPAAKFLTGAAMAGGQAGYEESLQIEDVFIQLKWQADQATPQYSDGGLAASRASLKNQDRRKVFMVDASTIVDNHNDILDPDMGRLIWYFIDNLQ